MCDRVPGNELLVADRITDEYLKTAAESAALIISVVTAEQNEMDAQYQAQAAVSTLEKEIRACGDRGQEFRKLVWSLLSASQQKRFRELLGTQEPSKDPQPSPVESAKEQPTFNKLKVGDRAISSVTGEEVVIERFFEKKGIMFASVKYLSPAYINDSQYGESRVDWLTPIDAEEEKES